jgi:hypothetical protein
MVQALKAPHSQRGLLHKVIEIEALPALNAGGGCRLNERWLQDALNLHQVGPIHCAMAAVGLHALVPAPLQPQHPHRGTPRIMFSLRIPTHEGIVALLGLAPRLGLGDKAHEGNQQCASCKCSQEFPCSPHPLASNGPSRAAPL